jgi:hypothetical protein
LRRGDRSDNRQEHPERYLTVGCHGRPSCITNAFRQTLLYAVLIDHYFDAEARNPKLSTFEILSSVLDDGQVSDSRRFQALQPFFGRF